MATRGRLNQIAQRMRFHKPKPAIREAAKKTRWNIVRGDKVQVIGGHPERGKQGTVLTVIRKQDRIIVEGVNMGKKMIKGDKDRGIPGSIIMKERSMHYSNVNLVDPIQNVPTRVYRQVLENGEKVRISKRSGAIIPKPEILKMRRRPVNSIVTESDTLDEDVWAITYDPK
mmetsp:Transcript_1007/g.2390  ORF Transcript_1007/g.2390 Transcript_1007/m.2390 type:complete len:171 (-) Transcript_1007:85-597(-)